MTNSQNGSPGGEEDLFEFSFFGLTLTGPDLWLLSFCPFAGFLGAFVGLLIKAEKRYRGIDAGENLEELKRSLTTHSNEIQRKRGVQSDYHSLVDRLGQKVDGYLKEVESVRRIVRIRNLIAGSVLGLVVALYFIGALENDITAVGRVLLLSVFAGYQALEIWDKLENAFSKAVDREIANVEGEGSK